MKFTPPLKKATLIKRYKRFLADVILADGSETTLHIANTGAMTGCFEPNGTIWYSTSDNPKRKLPLSWELTQTQKNHSICVNTARANQLVEEAINTGKISELTGYKALKREVKYGSENSKVDFLLSNDDDKCFVEVKSCTLLDEQFGDGQGFFPDTVTERGQKHLRELAEIAQSGDRAVLLFAVMHSGINRVSAAEHIDKKYAALLAEAIAVGVEVIAYKARFNESEIALEQAIGFVP